MFMSKIKEHSTSKQGSITPHAASTLLDVQIGRKTAAFCLQQLNGWKGKPSVLGTEKRGGGGGCKEV